MLLTFSVICVFAYRSASFFSLAVIVSIRANYLLLCIRRLLLSYIPPFRASTALCLLVLVLHPFFEAPYTRAMGWDRSFSVRAEDTIPYYILPLDIP